MPANCRWDLIQSYSDKIFKIKKKNVIRIITNSRMRDSCRELLKKLEILPLYSQYIFSISIFVIKNKHLFYTNNPIHTIHTRFKTNSHPPTANLTKSKRQCTNQVLNFLTTFLTIPKI